MTFYRSYNDNSRHSRRSRSPSPRDRRRSRSRSRSPSDRRRNRSRSPSDRRRNRSRSPSHKKIGEVEEKIVTILRINNDLSDKIRDQEDRSRRNNLRIDGIKENEKENVRDLEEKVKNLFQHKLDIKDDIEIERIHRTGRKKDGKPRTIILKLLRYQDKIKILQECRNLKGTNVWVNEDFSRETVERRRNLLNEIKTRKANGEEGLYLSYSTIKKYIKINNKEDGSLDDSGKNDDFY